MVNRPSFTEAQLTDLLWVDMAYGRPYQELDDLLARLALEVEGGPLEGHEHCQERNQAAYLRHLAGVKARRLLADNRLMPLWSANDLANGAQVAMDQHLKLHPTMTPDPAEMLEWQQQQAADVQEFYDEVARNQDAAGDYDHCWRRINQIVAVAAKWGVPPEQLVLTEAGRDALIRSTCTMEQFVAEAHRRLVELVESTQSLYEHSSDAQPLLSRQRALAEAWLMATTFRIWGEYPKM